MPVSGLSQWDRLRIKSYNNSVEMGVELIAIHHSKLRGATINQIKWGHPCKLEKGTYGCMTLETDRGDFIVSQAHNEISLFAVIKKGE